LNESGDSWIQKKRPYSEVEDEESQQNLESKHKKPYQSSSESEEEK
jgi:hypothetical protein